MRTYEEADAAARPGSPFSTSTEGEMWMERNCQRCANDTPAQVDRGEGCPLVLIALLGKTPAEWTRTGLSSYRCAEFVDVRQVSVPARRQPHEEIPGQEALVSLEEVQR